MNEQKFSLKTIRAFRAFALGGTGLALVLAGGILGGSFDLVTPTAALADPFRCRV